MNRRRFKPGDRVVYRKPKRSSSPGSRAQNISPSRFGEDYTYVVEKHWIVVAATGDKITVQTRTGKQHELDANSGCLRHARLWDILFHHRRFPDKSEPGTEK